MPRGIGAAGAGKTTLLKPLVLAWHEQGADIHGISLGWHQARDLREAGLNTDIEKGARDTIAAVSVFIRHVHCTCFYAMWRMAFHRTASYIERRNDQTPKIRDVSQPQ